MIRSLYTFEIGEEFAQMRSVPVALGPGREEAVLFIHSQHPNIDPWSEAFNYARDTLKLSLVSMSGKLLWRRDLDWGVVPGIWYTPVISFDLDGDGVDEIWYVGNTNPKLPLSIDYRVLERIDPLTGEVTGQWPWPKYPRNESMSHTYRYSLAAGYAHGQPVLITAQGTYHDMHLQAYNPGMEKRWEVYIPAAEPGARASHVFPILDMNGDGIDEIFWGERILSMDDGHELFCCDRDNFHAHSDIVAPFIDPADGRKYIYTCREGGGAPRVVTYDFAGNIVWSAVEAGHIHKGWVANIGENRRRIAMAMSLALGASGSECHKSTPILYYFDAVTGEPVEFKLPFQGCHLMPIDFTGDGYHEFYGTGGDALGKVYDRHGNLLADLGASAQQVRSGKILPRPGQQIMLGYGKEKVVRIWGDDAAAETAPDPLCERYHTFMQHLMGSGYNHINSVQSCGM